MILWSNLRPFTVPLLAAVACAADSANLGATLEERFQTLDRNHDGKLTREEAGGAAWFDRLDWRGTGVVTLEEIQALVRRFRPAAEDAAITRPLDPPAPAGALVTSVAEAAATSEGGAASPREAPKILKPAERGVGRLMPDFDFIDIHGQKGRLSDFRDARAVVIALTGTSCPLAKKYGPTLARLEKDFTAQGVVFLFVAPTATDTPAELRALAGELGLKGRIVHATAPQIVARLGAQTTTEAFVVDAARTVVFRGAVDDQYGLGYTLAAPRETYLREALTAVIAGQRPRIAATTAPGCALDAAVSPTPANPALGTETGTVTYHNRISRIIQNNCLECHHAGGVGPFSLALYEDVRAHAGMIRKQVTRGAMPPWFAGPTEPADSSHWRNDRTLAPADKADFLGWLAGEKVLGDPAEAPLPLSFDSGWLIGPPDTVLQFARPVDIKADGVMPYQTIRIATTFGEDRWVQAYEIRPTAREVVHHVIVRVHPAGERDAGKNREGANERDGFFAAYVPGNNHVRFPPGFAKKLPAGATISFQMHYTPNGKATTDQTRFGLIFSPTPPAHIIQVAGLANPRLRIPAGEGNHLESTSITLPSEITVLSFAPHMHVRGKAARYEAIFANGNRQRLLDVPAYDFNWQIQYQLNEPITLPRGTQLVYTAWYDNSAGNPANPDPSKTVRWGPQTFEEMMLGYVEYYVPGRGVSDTKLRQTAGLR